MKKFTQRIQRLNERANELRQTIESVPARITEVREAVAHATGHVQKLRADIVSSVSTLRAETDTQLLSTLHEIDQASTVLAEAGCRVDSVELDLGPTRCLVVHLERVGVVDAANVRGLLEANKSKPALHALLAALLKADELADKVEVTSLRWSTLRVQIGLVPSVRMGWQPSRASAVSAAAEPASTAGDLFAPAAEKSEVGTEPADATPSSFFARRSPTTTIKEPTIAAEADSPAQSSASVSVGERKPASSSSITSSVSPGAKWSSAALERFKKMPGVAARTG